MFSMASVIFIACSKQEVDLKSSTVPSVRAINKSTGIAMSNINLPADLRADSSYNGYVQEIDFRVDYQVSGSSITKQGFLKVRLADDDKIVAIQLSNTLLTDFGLDTDFIINDTHGFQTQMRSMLGDCLRANREAYGNGNNGVSRETFLAGRRACWNAAWDRFWGRNWDVVVGFFFGFVLCILLGVND